MTTLDKDARIAELEALVAKLEALNVALRAKLGKLQSARIASHRSGSMN